MSDSSENAAHFLEVAVAAAKEAGGILLEEFGRPKELFYKGDVDLVTESDRRSEETIVSRLRKDFPGHTIVAEEGTGKDSQASSRYVWYIDPLDGTTNFAHGYPCFAVSIGLFEDGHPLAGVVLNPPSHELFTALRGRGAWLNDKGIHVSEIDQVSQSLLATGFPTHKRTQNPNIRYYWDFTLRSHGVRRPGAAAVDLCTVACGRFEGFWEFGLKPWDSAAGMLIVAEAGGMVTNLEGEPYHPGDRSILATNGRVHQEMIGIATGIAAQPAGLGL